MTHEGNPGIKNVKHAQTYYYYTLDAADLTATSVITQDFCLFKLKFNADVVRWCHWENQCLLSKTYGTSVTGTFHNSYLWYDSIQVYRCVLMQLWSLSLMCMSHPSLRPVYFCQVLEFQSNLSNSAALVHKPLTSIRPLSKQITDTFF